MNNFKKLIPLVTLVGSLFFAIASHSSESLDRIVAVVNSHVITQRQLDAQVELARLQAQAENTSIPYAAQFRTVILDNLIDIELQRQLAQTLGIQIDDAGLEDAIANIAKSNGLTIKELRNQLTQENIPYAEYRQKIRDQLIIHRLQQDQVGAKISVTEQEITDARARIPVTDSTKTLYHVEDLLIPLTNNPSSHTLDITQQHALFLLQQAKNGHTFKQLVEQPDDASFNVSGTDLGWRPLNKFPDLFQAALKSLNPGEVTGPIHAQNGLHVLRLLATRGDSRPVSRTVRMTHVRHILIKTTPLIDNTLAKQRLMEIRAEILRGGNFADLAKKYSQDVNSSVKGGDLGWTTPGAFDSTFDAHVNKLALHELSVPFQTRFGWHLLEVLGREQKQQSLNSILHDQASQKVYEKKFRHALKDWLRELRHRSYVRVIQ